MIAYLGNAEATVGQGPPYGMPDKVGPAHRERATRSGQ
jgi:hypothetical protein